MVMGLVMVLTVGKEIILTTIQEQVVAVQEELEEIPYLAQLLELEELVVFLVSQVQLMLAVVVEREIPVA
jgi:hypothetical protein